MAQNEKPNVDDLFARMFGGTKPVEGNPGGEDKEENPPAQKTAAKPPAKAKKEVQPKPEKPAEPQEVAEPPAQEPAPKAKRGGSPLQNGNQVFWWLKGQQQWAGTCLVLA